MRAKLRIGVFPLCTCSPAQAWQEQTQDPPGRGSQLQIYSGLASSSSSKVCPVSQSTKARARRCSELIHYRLHDTPRRQGRPREGGQLAQDHTVMAPNSQPRLFSDNRLLLPCPGPRLLSCPSFKVRPRPTCPVSSRITSPAPSSMVLPHWQALSSAQNTLPTLWPQQTSIHPSRPSSNIIFSKTKIIITPIYQVAIPAVLRKTKKLLLKLFVGYPLLSTQVP